MVRAFYWKNNILYILNQKLLPGKLVYVRCHTYQQAAVCIKNMIVRGAPAIGVVAAYGLALAVQHQSSLKKIHNSFYKAKSLLASTRPTAANLFWALNMMDTVFQASSPYNNVSNRLLSAAHDLFKKDIIFNKKIGEYGAALLKPGSVLLTHCNAGALATAGWGTALGVIRTGFAQGKVRKVIIDETRPYLQGARLTAWELKYEKIPAELITDNMAGHMMKSGVVDGVIVGADRIAANGDCANKIGTYSLAVLARYHRIPFYVAAPVSTFDCAIAAGDDIPIEERSPHEVTHIGRISIAPKGMSARHPAFDVTPARLITAIITERGVIHKPGREKIKKILGTK